jgi:hypothetical protein
MRKATAAFIVLLTLVFGIAAQNNGEWIKYSSAEGRYTVLLPQDPKIITKEADSDNDQMTTHHFAWSPDGDVVFMVGYFDYQPPATFSFDKARDAILKAKSATLLGEEAVTLGGSPGRQLRLVMKVADGEIKMRLITYDVEHRVYTLQCIIPAEQDGPVTVEKCGKFIDSFKVDSR